MVSKYLLGELHTIFANDYGITLSDQDTSEVADGLLGYFDCLSSYAIPPSGCI